MNIDTKTTLFDGFKGLFLKLEIKYINSCQYVTALMHVWKALKFKKLYIFELLKFSQQFCGEVSGAFIVTKEEKKSEKMTIIVYSSHSNWTNK